MGRFVKRNIIVINLFYLLVKEMIVRKIYRIEQFFLLFFL
jgi:hypothetical protein